MSFYGYTYTGGTQQCTCVHCNRTFKGKDKRVRCCPRCDERVTLKCSCGCGTTLIRPRYRKGTEVYSPGHGQRGKTYQEIYGSTRPKCGYQPGKANIAKRRSVGRKISKALKAKGVACMLENKTPEQAEKLRVATARRLLSYKFRHRSGKYRSRMENDFAKALRSNGVKFVHEPTVISVKGKIYFPDFQVRRTYIEISGFAYKSWQDAFVKKMRTLSKTHKHLHVVVPDNVVPLADRRLGKYVTRVWPESSMQSLANYLRN